MKRVMFVCTGNTCRSPMAELIFKSFLKENSVKGVSVSSAGLCVTENAINPKAKIALKNHGITPRKFTPKNVTKELANKQNAIICMTSEQKSKFIGFTNIYTINELTGIGEIADPYGGEQNGYDQCFDEIYKSVKIIYDLIMEDTK